MAMCLSAKAANLHGLVLPLEGQRSTVFDLEAAPGDFVLMNTRLKFPRLIHALVSLMVGGVEIKLYGIHCLGPCRWCFWCLT